MLTWNDTPQRDLTGKILCVSYKADIPTGERPASIPTSTIPARCSWTAQDWMIQTHPLGRVFAEDAITPAERALMEALEQRGIWCLEALAAIGLPEN